QQLGPLRRSVGVLPVLGLPTLQGPLQVEGRFPVAVGLTPEQAVPLDTIAQLGRDAEAEGDDGGDSPQGPDAEPRCPSHPSPPPRTARGRPPTPATGGAPRGSYGRSRSSVRVRTVTVSAGGPDEAFVFARAASGAERRMAFW